MIDMITIVGVHGFRHHRWPSGSKADEDQFYAEFGDSSTVRFAAWLTSLDLIIKGAASKERRRKDGAKCCGGRGRAPQATFLAPK
ncbi:hypothetical protein [Rhizobium bangladeshense]|uniref:hypothetical protein n=1 Tax=Rhizobium bangladeshense TaxID=1138189 RepID=UPI001A99FB3F|nr:hypothetical protein [Rhizobium bangladeshense]MBX4932473.1 hypothetical protein [Rhizobium bangladeshense]MBY3579771.1 hypothetical protein [Rhizobium bangladeshense]QSY89242.1 hypothetical protein J2J98_03550 [Rhizobium bangladeshense]